MEHFLTYSEINDMISGGEAGDQQQPQQLGGRQHGTQGGEHGGGRGGGEWFPFNKNYICRL